MRPVAAGEKRCTTPRRRRPVSVPLKPPLRALSQRSPASPTGRRLAAGSSSERGSELPLRQTGKAPNRSHAWRLSPVTLRERLGQRLELRQCTGLEYLAAFLQQMQLIDSEVFELIDLTAQPANLHHVYFDSLVQSEMHAQVVLRKVTATAAQLLHLLQRFSCVGTGSGCDRH